MRGRFTKQGEALIPFDDESREMIKKWKPGDFVEVDAKRPRNGKFHRLFFAMLGKVKESYHDQNITTDTLLTHIKTELNMWDVIQVGNTYQKQYHHISYAKMDEDEFAQFYSRALDVCLTLVPLDRDDLAMELVSNFG